MRFLGEKDTCVFIFGITLLIVSLRVNANLCLHHGLKVFLPFLKSITLYTFHLFVISFLLLTFSKFVHLRLPIEISAARVTPLISLNMIHTHGRKFKTVQNKMKQQGSLRHSSRWQSPWTLGWTWRSPHSSVGDGLGSILTPLVVSCVTLTKFLISLSLFFHHLKEGHSSTYLIGWLWRCSEVMQLKCLPCFWSTVLSI